ncbi:unnamed protein product [Symbiodinium sp. CCMP2456]|nr:unnamed protein product [Symbiodinium sp. CCMP2456]
MRKVKGRPFLKTFMFFVVNSFRSCGAATMRPVYHRTMWSLTIAYRGRRPQVGPDNMADSVPAMYRKLKPAMQYRFACVQYKGDWEYHEKCWALQTYWRTKRICFLCHASLNARHGTCYTLFGAAFTRRTPVDMILNSMPAQPNPLVLVPGWHPQLLRYCAMHSLQLGIYQIVTAESLLWLCRHGVFGGPHLDIDVRLANAYVAFKSWMASSRLTCSGRMFSSKRLHLCSTDYPYLGYKAYNTRVVLAFVAAQLCDNRVQDTMRASMAETDLVLHEIICTCVCSSHQITRFPCYSGHIYERMNRRGCA